MKTVFIFLSCFILGASACLGAESGHSFDQEESSTSSAKNREQKRFQVTGQPTGLRGSSVLAGATASLFLNPDSLLFFTYTAGQAFYIGDSLDHESLATNTYSLGFKHFTTNSFYFRGGLNYTTVEYHRYEDDSSGNNLLDKRLDGNYTSASFAIGNQWQWSAFTLGCDWVGISKPLFYTVTRDQVTGPNATAGINNDGTRSSYFVDAQLEVAHFYLGASF